MAFSFRCPACSADLVMSSARPGHDARCTSCGADIVVPMEARELTAEEARQAIGGRADRDYEEEVPEEIRNCKFNFGAFLMTPIWLLLHRRVLAGILLILLLAATNMVGGAAPFLGLLGFVISIAISVYFGINGYRIAWQDRGYYDTVDDVMGRERKWAILGIVVAILLWGVQILAIL